MTNQFLLTAGVLLVLNLAGNVFFSSNPVASRSDAGIINISGKQRLLCSQINHLAHDYLLGDFENDDEKKRQLIVAADAMYRNHIELVKSIHSDQVQRMFFDQPLNVDERLREFVENAETLAETTDPRVAVTRATAINENANHLLADLDRITNHIQVDQEHKIFVSYLWGIGGMTASMIFLAAVGLFIFRPMEKRLHLHAHELEEKVDLRTSELEVYRVTLENISDAVFITDYSGKLVFVCPNAEVIFGFQRHELSDIRNISELIGDNLFNQEELLAFGELSNIERDITDKHGQIHNLLITVKRVSIEGGNFLYTCRDITKLRETQEELDSFFTLSPDLMCISNSSGEYIRINPAVVETLGWEEAEILAKPFYDYLHPDDVPATERRMAILDEGGITGHFENRYQCIDGSYRWLEWMSRRGNRGQIFSVARDVTDQRRFQTELIAAREKAEEMNRLKDIFLSNMSHEIRTPLTNIIATADLMSQERYEDESITEFIKFISDGGRRLMQTINSVLELAQLESQNRVLKAEPFNFVTEVREATDFFQRQAHISGLTLKFESDVINIPVSLDRAALGRIVMNLVGNALKFTENGSVSVRVESETKLVKLIVSDTGIGIDPDFQPLLFEEFRQESSGLDRGFEGNGLGLTLTKQLTDLMGGSIFVESEKSKGSVFTVMLPRILPLN